MDRQLQEAFIHRPHSVLGQTLRPFCLAHLFSLLVIDSPFLSAAPKRWEDLQIAVAICTSEDPVTDLHKVLYKIPARSKLQKFFFPKSLTCEGGKFMAYLQDFHALPLTAESGGGKKAKAPWILRMVETFRRNGRTEWEAWHTPTGEAFFNYATIQELDGAELDLIDEEEQELLSLLDKPENTPWVPAPKQS